MRESKFLKLFSTLNQKEQNDFEKFLTTLHASHLKVNSLFLYIKNHYADEGDALDKDVVADQVFKIKNPSTQQRKNIDNYLSILSSYLEEFLILKKHRQKEIWSGIQLLEIYKSRKLDDLYFAKIEALKKQISKDKNPNLWSHLDLMRLHHDTFFHTNYSKIKTGVNPLKKSMYHLNHFFALAKLKLAAEMLNRQNVLQETYDIHLLEEAIHYLTKVEQSSSIFIPLIQFLQKPSEEGFKDLKKQFFKSFKKLDSDEQLIFITYLLNYTSAKMKQGNIQAYTKAFELFQFGIKHQIFINEDGYLSRIQFINITVVGCSVKQLDWVEKFIKNFSKFLIDEHQENTILMAKACLRFEEKKFNDVIAISSAIQFSDDYFSLRTRAIVLCSYYELYHQNDIPLIQDYCKAYAHFINRNKTINPATLDSFFSLIKFVRLMLRKKVNYEKLNLEIQQSQYMFYKPWILEKIEAFNPSS